MPINLVKACLLVTAFLLIPGCRPDVPQPVKTLPEITIADQDPDSGGLLPGVDTFLLCTGIFEIPTSQQVLVSPPVGGVIRTIRCAPGNYVRKGSVLAILENVDFLKLQQEYLVAKSQLSYFGEELKRQGELAIENASSVKKLQQAQLDYQVCEARLHSLAAQLTLAGFMPDSVDVDHLSPTISIHAPDSGYIVRVFTATGLSIGAGDRLFQMVRDNRPVLVIDIPEKFHGKVRIGQKLDFTLPGDSSTAYKARLSYIHPSVDRSSRSFRVNAIPYRQSGQFVTGMHFSAKLYTCHAKGPEDTR